MLLKCGDSSVHLHHCVRDFVELRSVNVVRKYGADQCAGIRLFDNTARRVQSVEYEQWVVVVQVIYANCQHSYDTIKHFHDKKSLIMKIHKFVWSKNHIPKILNLYQFKFPYVLTSSVVSYHPSSYHSLLDYDL